MQNMVEIARIAMTKIATRKMMNWTIGFVVINATYGTIHFASMISGQQTNHQNQPQKIGSVARIYNLLYIVL